MWLLMTLKIITKTSIELKYWIITDSIYWSESNGIKGLSPRELFLYTLLKFEIILMRICICIRLQNDILFCFFLWVLGHINLCRLFYPKSIFIQKQFYFKKFILAKVQSSIVIFSGFSV